MKSLNQNKKFYKLECPICHCTFVAKESDFIWVDNPKYAYVSIEITCPNCDEILDIDDCNKTIL